MAARENASSSKSIFDLQDLLKKIALRDKVDESREFASRIQQALYGLSSKSTTSARNRGVKKAPFVVLIGASSTRIGPGGRVYTPRGYAAKRKARA